MDFYGVGIYIIIIIVAGLFVAFIILLMARSMLRETSAPSQEREAEELPWRKLTQRLRLRLKPERESSPPLSPQPEVQLPPPVSTEPKPGQSASPGRLEPEPSQQVSLEPETGPTNTMPQETEVTTSPSLEMELPESFDEEEEKSGKRDDVLNLFRVEEVEDTGLSDLAESLEEVDIHSLIRVTEEVSHEIRGK